MRSVDRSLRALAEDPRVTVSTVGPSAPTAGRVVVVALHGLGDTPERFALWLRALPVSARVLSVRGHEAYGDGFAWWQPNADERAQRTTVERAMRYVEEAVTGHLEREPRCGAPMLVGFSQGAMVSFGFAAKGSSFFRVIIPIGGRMPSGLLEGGAPGATLRVRALHGAIDERVPLVGARSAIDALRARGMDATLRVFDQVGHSIPDEVRLAAFDEIERAAREMGCAR